MKILCAVALFALFLFAACTQAAELTAIEPLLSPSTRLMVFSPHPDDETLGAGGLIQRVLEAGGKVKVVFMTNGDGYLEGVELEDHTSHPTASEYDRYGQIRRHEAERALATLGVKAHNVIFLGFPDGGLSDLRLKSCVHGDPYRSPFTQKNRPPRFELILPRTDYCAQDLASEIERVILRFRPTLVVTTGPQDLHPDHKTTYYFVKDALSRLGRKFPLLKPVFLTFVIHFDGWPVNQEASSGARLDPPEGFPVPRTKWITFNLKPAEVNRKREAIEKYHSQMLLLNRFMLCFAKSDELFLLDPGSSAGERLQLSKSALHRGSDASKQALGPNRF
ncbi:MAG: PIG-L deacetylase family protein [Syntrophobacteraceae bacterium]